jgi:hypothetical protein
MSNAFSFPRVLFPQTQARDRGDGQLSVYGTSSFREERKAAPQQSDKVRLGLRFVYTRLGSVSSALTRRPVLHSRLLRACFLACCAVLRMFAPRDPMLPHTHPHLNVCSPDSALVLIWWCE